MALPPYLALEPSKLINSLDFESKGLSSPVFLSYSRNDGKEARLVVKAVYRGPTPGWPILDKKRIYDNAHKMEEEDRFGASAVATTTTTTTAVNVLGTNTQSDHVAAGLTTNDVPICLAETNPVYPIHVIVHIALTMQPGACDDMFKAARAYSQLYANGYLPYELPVAIWRTAEGMWSLVLDEGGTALPSWWEQHVQPQIHASESRWKIGSWRAASSADGDPGAREAIEETAEELRRNHQEEQQEQKKRIHFMDEAAQQIGGLMKEKEKAASDHGSYTGSNIGSGTASNSGSTLNAANGSPKAQQKKVLATLGEKADEILRGDQQQQQRGSSVTSGADGVVNDDDEHVEISPSKKQEWASRIHQQNQEMQNAHRVVPRSGETTPVADGQKPSLMPTTKTIGVDEDEEEAMVIDRGWLPAINILIQLADIILVSGFPW